MSYPDLTYRGLVKIIHVTAPVRGVFLIKHVHITTQCLLQYCRTFQGEKTE